MRGRPLVHLALALAVFAMSLVAFDRLISLAFEWVDPAADGHAGLVRKLTTAAARSRYDVLILGTSRAYEAVHPAVIQETLHVRAYKEAFHGKGPRYNYEFYKLYRQVVGTPKVVVYGIDYFIFNITSEKYALERFNRAMSVSPHAATGPLLLLSNKKAHDRSIISVVEQFEPRSTFDPEANTGDMESYRGYTGPNRPDVRVPAQYQRQGFPHYPGKEGEYLVRLLQELQRDGVAILLIYPPDYAATHESNFEHAEFRKYFTDLAREIRGCRFVDYCDAARFPLSDAELFGDGGYGNPNSHLTKRGADTLAPLLMPDLKKALEQAR